MPCGPRETSRRCNQKPQIGSHRANAQPRDPVLGPFNHGNPEAMELEHLPGLGNHLRFVNDKAGDGIGLIIWQ